MTTRLLLPPAAVAVAGVLLVACGDRSPVAYGDLNAVIVAAPDDLWGEIEAPLRQALEPTILAVREERTFDLTRSDPADPRWTQLRKFRQLLLFGDADDEWMQPVLEQAPAAEPGVVMAEDVWARGQVITAVLLPDEGRAEFVRQLLPELHSLFDRRFRALVRQRMFASGVDTALADTLRREAGFSLVLPEVYTWAREGDLLRFLNVQPKGGDQVLRSILVTWRPGSPAELSPADVLEWRSRIAETVYDPAQAVEERIETETLEAYAGPAVEVVGTWSGRGDWPMGGPFIARVVACPAQDRTYFLDAYLFAPTQDKYEYMLQLETILDSFECGGQAG